MSYPPNPYDEHGSPLINGQSSTARQSEDVRFEDIKDKEEEELNAVRRYEDFTTVGRYYIGKGAPKQLTVYRLDTGQLA